MEIFRASLVLLLWPIAGAVPAAEDGCPDCPVFSNELDFTIGYSSNSESIGSIKIKMFGGQNGDTSNDFRDMAMGSDPPRTQDNRYSSSSSGFKGMTMNTVFPQFDGCNGGPEQAYKSMEKGANGPMPIQGKEFSGEAFKIPTKPTEGQGILSIIKGNAYVIRAPHEIPPVEFRDIGLIEKTGMMIAKRVNALVCGTPLGNRCRPSARRVKRQSSSTSITDISLK